MRNSDISAALEYHEATKHSLDSVRRDRHTLDWENQPRPFKLYVGLEPLPLPLQYKPSSTPALRAIAESPPNLREPCVPDLGTLASVLHYSAGITKQLRYPGGLMAFRAAACTGALYHIELYVVCGDLTGLPAGVYHFGVHDNALRRLREGDFRAALAVASGEERAVAAAPATIVCTSTYWRNAWKYEVRAYRHCFWDNGTILANMLAMASAHRLPARVVTGFVDDDVNRLIGVDGEREVTLSLVPLGFASDALPASPGVEPLTVETAPISRREVDYPAIRAMHRASVLSSAEEVAAWRGAAERVPEAGAGGAPMQAPVPLQAPDASALPGEPIEQVIQRRGSSRRFAAEPLPFEALSRILTHTQAEFPADFRPRPGEALAEPSLIVNAVEGVSSGAYFYDRRRQALEPLQQGDFRESASFLALTQSLAGDAAVNVYFLADLETILARLGNRGYRAAQLDASLTAGRIYLAAYALGFGATGLTFFDDDVTRFFSPHAAGKSVMFLIALGKPSRRPRTSS